VGAESELKTWHSLSQRRLGPCARQYDPVLHFLISFLL
jgi:hypothetical protein